MTKVVALGEVDESAGAGLQLGKLVLVDRRSDLSALLAGANDEDLEAEGRRRFCGRIVREQARVVEELDDRIRSAVRWMQEKRRRQRQG